MHLKRPQADQQPYSKEYKEDLGTHTVTTSISNDANEEIILTTSDSEGFLESRGDRSVIKVDKNNRVWVLTTDFYTSPNEIRFPDEARQYDAINPKIAQEVREAYKGFKNHGITSAQEALEIRNFISSEVHKVPGRKIVIPLQS
jgi:hypothetical protein